MSAANDFHALAIECSGERIAVGVFDRTGTIASVRERASAHAHAKNLLALVDETLAAAGIAPRDLAGIAIDVGPGSFTALRVGLATARGLSQPFDTPLMGVTSFAALVEGVSAPKRLVVPLVIAGRTQLYAGFYRGDAKGELSILRGPAVGDLDALAASVDEALALCPRGTTPYFLGPGAARERDALEARHPGSLRLSAEADGADERVAGADGPRAEAVARLGARLLAPRAALKASRAAAAATPAPAPAPAPAAGADDALRPLYVRAPQAVEKAQALRPFAAELTFTPFAEADLDDALVIENAVFTDPWPRTFFLEEIRAAQSVACVARHRGILAGYLMAWRLDAEMHLGNLAVAPAYQRRGVGQALLAWLLETGERAGIERITLEVRATNFAAQELYRRFGFQAVALRRGYYQDTGEDALVLLRDLAPES